MQSLAWFTFLSAKLLYVIAVFIWLFRYSLTQFLANVLCAYVHIKKNFCKEKTVFFLQTNLVQFDYPLVNW